jgi:hypothetical protein
MAVRPFVPAGYTRGELPLLPNGEGPFVRGELDKIQDSIASIIEMTPQGTTFAPRTPRHGMIRLAMDPWRPIGGSVDVWVYYDEDAAAWAAL